MSLFERYPQLTEAGISLAILLASYLLARALSHLRAYESHGGGRPLGESVAYEFGAGWDLAIPLAYASLGVGRQVLVDIRPNLRLELVNASIARAGSFPPEPEGASACRRASRSA